MPGNLWVPMAGMSLFGISSCLWVFDEGKRVRGVFAGAVVDFLVGLKNVFW